MPSRSGHSRGEPLRETELESKHAPAATPNPPASLHGRQPRSSAVPRPAPNSAAERARCRIQGNPLRPPGSSTRQWDRPTGGCGLQSSVGKSGLARRLRPIQQDSGYTPAPIRREQPARRRSLTVGRGFSGLHAKSPHPERVTSQDLVVEADPGLYFWWKAPTKRQTPHAIILL